MLTHVYSCLCSRATHTLLLCQDQRRLPCWQRARRSASEFISNARQIEMEVYILASDSARFGVDGALFCLCSCVLRLSLQVCLSLSLSLSLAVPVSVCVSLIVMYVCACARMRLTSCDRARMPELTNEMQTGLQVKSIAKGSSAEKCGMVRIGDEIVAVNGVSVHGCSLVGSQTINHKPYTKKPKPVRAYACPHTLHTLSASCSRCLLTL